MNDMQKLKQVESIRNIEEVSSLMWDLSKLIDQYSHIHFVKEVADLKGKIEKVRDLASKNADEWYAIH
jgi:hypothetical protein